MKSFTIFAEHALTASGWQREVLISVGADGRIVSVGAGTNTPSEAQKAGVLLPSPANLHSHAFQRAMAGLTERRGPDPRDTFWTWRELMYRFLEKLTPEHVEAIAAFVQMEMLEAGYAAVGEFHYLHNQPGGEAYANPAELSLRIIEAAKRTGIGLTLLPVLYQQGGCDGRPLQGGQLRFASSTGSFAKLHEAANAALGELPPDAVIGVAPHSLRAVSRENLAETVRLAPSAPLHMHIAEQAAEVEEVEAAWGKRPVEWLFENHEADERWCLIHCTQVQPHETAMLAKSGAVAGLCPITESSLGDGIFEGADYLMHAGRFGVGSDSNIRISLAEELRTLEYSQRLRDRSRAVLATPDKSTGRILFESAAQGGAQAAGRDAGAIEPEKLADLVALDACATNLLGKSGDAILDSYIFGGDDRLVTDVWSAGRHLVQEGRHFAHEAIEQRYRQVITALGEQL